MQTRWTILIIAALVGCDGPQYADPNGSGSGDPPRRRDAGRTVVADGGAATPNPMLPPEDDEDGDGYVDFDADDDATMLPDEWVEALDMRVVDYNAALRKASLRLRGTLPTLTEIRLVQNATAKRAVYEDLIDEMLDAPASQVQLYGQLRAYFRDTFRIGGDATFESAPLFAAQLAMEDRSMNELFTATSGTCPTWDATTNAVVPADCQNIVGGPQHAGILTNPGVQKQFFSNFGFRRVRWMQETFVCRPFPAEATTPVDVGGANPYTAPWPFESIAGMATGGRIDFLSLSSVTCANCHATLNHVAPLLANFDAEGMYMPSIAVPVPLDMAPMAVLGDYLPPGEGTAWRLGVPVSSLAELGRAIADDPATSRCSVERAWNWAFGKGDVVTTLQTVPDAVIRELVTAYDADGQKFRPLLRAIFTSEDFVRF